MLLTALPALLLATVAAAAELRGVVVNVADGDTLTVLESTSTPLTTRRQHRVRLAGIDAPERRQPFGTRAKQHLAALVLGREVTVAWEKRDRYGRIVGRVLAPECASRACAQSLDAGLAQIRAGLAWHYKRYASEQPPEERRRYAAAEEAARADKTGLWRDVDAVPPWEFRRTARAVHEPRADGAAHALDGPDSPRAPYRVAPTTFFFFRSAMIFA